MVIRNKLVKWYINNCEYMKIIVVNRGLRDESDLRSIEHYLSSSENKAWKISGSCGIWTRHEVFERKVFHLWNKIFKAQVSHLRLQAVIWSRCKKSFFHLNDYWQWEILVPMKSKPSLFLLSFCRNCLLSSIRASSWCRVTWKVWFRMLGHLKVQMHYGNEAIFFFFFFVQIERMSDK